MATSTDRTTVIPTRVIVVPADPVTPPSAQRPAPSTAPAVTPPTWSGRKTAVAAALAIGFASVGAVGAAAAMPDQTAQTGTGGFPGGRFRGGQNGFPGGQNGFPGGQLPGGQNGLNGQTGSGAQGNQLPGLPQGTQGSQGTQPGQLPVLPQTPAAQDGQSGEQGLTT
jgi:hypothetical protein